MRVLLSFQDASDDRLDDLLMLEGQNIEAVSVGPHGLLVTTCPGRFVDLHCLLIFVDLQEGTDVVWLRQEQAGVA